MTGLIQNPLPEFDADYAVDESVLRCPHCGDNYTHQGCVEVFNRDQEDSITGLHVVVSGLDVSKNTDMAGNPSGRRQGITIEFWCENCSHNSVLGISQHKGFTLVGWKACSLEPEKEVV